jgi:hypothetical protein
MLLLLGSSNRLLLPPTPAAAIGLGLLLLLLLLLACALPEHHQCTRDTRVRSIMDRG